VGWYHTHLFSATDSFGLSGMDQDLHHRFLPRPWQAAVLVNISHDGNRQIRCFQRKNEGMLEQSFFEVVKKNI